MRMSTVIGHRGAASLAPENTLAGIRKAFECGLSWVELDVVLLGDGNLVIHHDHTLRRCTTGRGNISHLSLEDVKEADAGVKFAPEFAGETVPTLAEALALIAELGIGLNLEIKMHNHHEHELVLPVLKTLQQQKFSPEKLLISCFNHEALTLCRDHAPEYPRGSLFVELPDNWLELVQDAGSVTVHCCQRNIQRKQVTEVVHAGYDCYTYTVNDKVRASQLLSWGVSGVFSDDPFVLSAETTA